MTYVSESTDSFVSAFFYSRFALRTANAAHCHLLPGRKHPFSHPFFFPAAIVRDTFFFSSTGNGFRLSISATDSNRFTRPPRPIDFEDFLLPPTIPRESVDLKTSKQKKVNEPYPNGAEGGKNCRTVMPLTLFCLSALESMRNFAENLTDVTPNVCFLSEFHERGFKTYSLLQRRNPISGLMVGPMICPYGGVAGKIYLSLV